MLDMANKSSSGGQGPNRSPARTIHARVSPRIGEAFEAYMDSLRPKPSLKAVLEVILEEFLIEKGFLEPEGPDADQGDEA